MGSAGFSFRSTTCARHGKDERIGVKSFDDALDFHLRFV